MSDGTAEKRLDTFGLLCPMPIIKLAERMRGMDPGAVLEILSDDPGIVPDLPAWCESHGHTMVSLEETAPGEFRGRVRKRQEKKK